MTRCCRNTPAALSRAGDRRFGRPEQEKRPARVARGKTKPLAFLEIEGLCDEAGDSRCRARTQTLFERPESIRLLVRLDQRDAAGVEAEGLEAMAMKLAHGGETLCGGDDEKGPIHGE